MTLNSRQKGARFERMVAGLLRDIFGNKARRGQQFSGSPDSPDVVDGIKGVHLECKAVEKLNLWSAFSQAVRDCGDRLPAVVCKRNRSEVLITIRLSDLLTFAELVVEEKNQGGTDDGMDAISFTHQR